MKLWLISQSINSGYDTYSDAVVAAKTEEEAKMIHPDGEHRLPIEKPNYDLEYDPNWIAVTTWVRYLSEVRATLLGTAIKGTKAGIICASFHAG